MVIILMGVSGCGKTTVGKLLAEKMKLPFYDADHFHPAENVRKMRSGRPLNDAERKPWLETLAQNIADWNQSGGAVLACSALKGWYRDLLISRSEKKDVFFVYLKGSKKLISERLKSRDGHYMPAELLDSQFDTLEEPRNVITIPIAPSPEVITTSILNALELNRIISH
jgi:carbohydrate kinase (thermoresistant glucokinase family)